MKLLSKITDFVFHPLLFPIYGIAIFLNLTPYYSSEAYRKYLFLVLVLLGVLMPLIVYMILQSLRLFRTEDSVQKHKYAIVSYSFIWIILNIKVFSFQVNSDFSWLVSFILIGYGLLLLAILFRKKWSIRMMVMGVLTVFTIVLGFLYRNNYTLIISFLTLFSGWIASQQLYMQKHTVSELIYGWLSGCLFQLLIFGYRLMMM